MAKASKKAARSRQSWLGWISLTIIILVLLLSVLNGPSAQELTLSQWNSVRGCILSDMANTTVPHPPSSFYSLPNLQRDSIYLQSYCIPLNQSRDNFTACLQEHLCEEKLNMTDDWQYGNPNGARQPLARNISAFMNNINNPYKRVAVLGAYNQSNYSQSEAVNICASLVVQSVSHSRHHSGIGSPELPIIANSSYTVPAMRVSYFVMNASSFNRMDFYIIQNKTSCAYINETIAITTPNGSYVVANSTYCLSRAAEEPSIFINYSDTNSTVVTPEHVYIKGDYRYLSECLPSLYFA